MFAHMITHANRPQYTLMFMLINLRRHLHVPKLFRLLSLFQNK